MLNLYIKTLTEMSLEISTETSLRFYWFNTLECVFTTQLCKCALSTVRIDLIVTDLPNDC